MTPPLIAGLLAADERTCAAVADQIANAYVDTDYPRPTVGGVIERALDVVASDVADRAHDLAECDKVDDCAAEAVVLRRLVELLRGMS